MFVGVEGVGGVCVDGVVVVTRSIDVSGRMRGCESESFESLENEAVGDK